MPQSPIVDGRGRPYPSAEQRKMLRAAHDFMSGGFRAADPVSQELGSWRPVPWSADTANARGRTLSTGRIHDQIRNSPWASNAVRRELEAVIGANLRLNYNPDAEALGLDQDWAEEMEREVEGRWRIYANDTDMFCDQTRRQTVPGMFGLAYRHYAVDGDALGVIGFRPRQFGAATTLQVVHPLRLSNPNEMLDTDRLRGGVELDEDGAAIAYHIRDSHPYDAASWTAPAERFSWTRVERETPWCRPNVLHVFDLEEAGQTRGQSRLNAMVEALHMTDKYERVELQAAIVNAILAAVITTPMDTDVVSGNFAQKETFGQYHELREAFHDTARISLGGVALQHLFPGEDLKFHAASRPAANYEPFVSTALRKIAAAAGISYEQLSGDWSKTNYSSARAALLEIWRGFFFRRHVFTSKFCTPFFGAWLEEQIAEDRIPAYREAIKRGAPEFWEAKAAYLRCEWLGPGRGWVDPEKEAKAVGLRLALGLSTVEDELAEQGKDIDQVLPALARERAKFTDAGIAHPLDRPGALSAVTQGGPETPPSAEDEGEDA